ncbi:MAG TPA: hypothetical protein VJ844_13850 [Mucilaginibacter sp.]|nr:hypothetical protein [Mucilaginibacter sp.]
MMATIIKVVLLLAIIIVPLRGPSKRREHSGKNTEQTTIHSGYSINENGMLERTINDSKEA